MATLGDIGFASNANGNGRAEFPLSCHSNTLLLAAATNETIAVPAGAQFVQIGASTEAWVKIDGVFSGVPAADITTGAAGIVLRAGATKVYNLARVTGNLNFIAAATPLINVVFFQAKRKGPLRAPFY